MTTRTAAHPLPELFSTIPLEGTWQFAYTPSLDGEQPVLPDDAMFSASLSVPGYWDEQTAEFCKAPWWPQVVLNKADGFGEIDGLSGEAERAEPEKARTTEEERRQARYVSGVGWYRRQVMLPIRADGWREATVHLNIAEIRHYAHVWIGREYAGCLRGHRAAWSLDISPWCRPGDPVEITLAVGNDTLDTTFVDSGCFSHSGGIVGSVALHLAGPVGIADLYVRAGDDLQTVAWTCRVTHHNPSVAVHWQVTSAEGRLVAEGIQPIDGTETVEWHSRIPELQPWDPDHPHLYSATVELIAEDAIYDRATRRFGMRQWRVDGKRLQLNGRTVFLVANCASSHFPLHVAMPYDKAYYVDYLSKLKALGFNTLKFLFMTPALACLEAADELGLIVSPSVDYFPPAGDASYLERMVTEVGDLARTYRNFVSVAIYRLSGERYCDEAFLNELGRLTRSVKAAHPGALVLPSHASRGIEYMMNLCDARVADTPFQYHPERLRLMSAFADVIGRYPEGMLSYYSPGDATWRDVDAQSMPFDRPMLSHEIGMKASYLNLENEHRYTGILPPVFYRRCREQLVAQELIDRASRYYEMSCRVQQVVRKYCIEENRLCRTLAGYEYLGCTDHFLPIDGYPSGFMDEFHTLKPGESPAEIRRYQSESVLLLNFPDRRVRTFWSGQAFAANWTAALFGAQPIALGCLTWELRDGQHILWHDATNIHAVPNGMVSILEPIKFCWPQVSNPTRLTLTGRLTADGYDLENTWDFWVFPRTDPPAIRADGDPDLLTCLAPRYAPVLCQDPTARLRLRAVLTKDDVAYLEDGGDVLLIGVTPFESSPLFNPLATGHSSAQTHHVGTILHDHPIFNGFPHEGFGDWQCYSLLRADASCIVWRDPSWPFAPILEVISSDKDVRRQACIFEVTVGRGRLFVFTCPTDVTSPSSVTVLDAVFRHVQSDDFRPVMALPSAGLYALLNRPPIVTLADDDARRHSLTCPTVQIPPACDGRLADTAWNSAPAIVSSFGGTVVEKSHAEQAYNAGAGTAGFTLESDVKLEEGAFRATVRCIHDEQYLYFAILVDARENITLSTPSEPFLEDYVSIRLPSDYGTYLMALTDQEPFLLGLSDYGLRLRLGITRDAQRMVYEVALPNPQRQIVGADERLDIRVDVFHRESPSHSCQVISMPLELCIEP